jgi:hypothetical protein
MTFTPPRGPGRCPECGWHRRTQGHKPDCPRGRCRRCKQFLALPGTLWCLWCTSEREQVIAERLAEILESGTEP